MPSLCSPDCSSPEDDLAFMTLNMEDDMDLRAPYIPMSESDDLPLLISDDLMWGAHSETLAKELKFNMVNNIAKNKSSLHRQQNLQSSTNVKPNTESSLAALLCGTTQIRQETQNIKPSIIERRGLYSGATIDEDNKIKLIDHQTEDQIVSPIDVIGQAYKCKFFPSTAKNVNF